MTARELVDRLADLQVRRPWAPLALVAAFTVFFAFFASKLTLKTRYDALLPDSQPTVQELRRVESRVSSGQTVLILLEAPDRSVLRAMGDALLPKLEALGPDIVSSAVDGVHEGRRFLAPRAGLFLDRKELERLSQDVDARWDYEVAKETGSLLDEGASPPSLTADEMKRRFSSQVRSRDLHRYPDGYFEREDGTALVVVVRSPIPGGDLGKIGPALDAMRAVVKEVQATGPAFGAVRVSYAGDMTTGFIEYGVVLKDLLNVGAIGVALVLAVVLLYFMRLRALFVMGLSIFVGLIWTFGFTEIVIGHLNVATAFLISIVAGNGINVGILYQARYFEERRKGQEPPEALKTAVRTTWLPTVIAAVAAAASYGSLMISDFRAFRHFGFIAASGMLLCWVVKTLMVPPLLLLLERPGRPSAAWSRRFGLGYGNLFAWLVPKAPKVFLAAGILLTFVGAVLGVRYAQRDPMEYNLRAVQNDRTVTADLHRAWAICTEILGGSQGAMVVVTDTPDEARQLEDQLWARWDAAPKDEKPFVSVRSLFSFVPKEQAEKIPTLVALGGRLRQAHDKRFINDDDWRVVKEILPEDDLAPFTAADLPESITGPFTEKNGTKGTLVLIESEPTASDDLRYLLRYSDSFRETKLPSGKTVRGSGMVVVFADMLTAVVRDVPRVVALSLGMTLLAVFITFRNVSRSLPVLFALLVGVAGVAVFLYVDDVKLNFLNFSALPITFGIGVDYAVNVAQRYYADGQKDILSALRTSGGAVVLCSLTTTVGYLALLGSHNAAIRGLGTIAVVGEVSCLLAAVLVMPSLWLIRERRRPSSAALTHAPGT